MKNITIASCIAGKTNILLAGVDIEDSGLYEIADPFTITVLETYTPSCNWSSVLLLISLLMVWTGLQTPQLKRIAEIVSAQAIATQPQLQQKREHGVTLSLPTYGTRERRAKSMIIGRAVEKRKIKSLALQNLSEEGREVWVEYREDWRLASMELQQK